MKNYLIEEKELNGGIQKIYKFPNGYGASVINSPYSYGGERGLWEIAVIKFTPLSPTGWKLDYDTPITDDVLGYLTLNQVKETLNQIKNLETVVL